MPEPLYNWVNMPTVGRSNFDLSFAKYLTTDFFRLVPVMVKECVPGDTWTIGNRVVMRFQPMFAPVLADISVRTHYFFVPYRLLWSREHDAPPGYDSAAFSNSQLGFNAFYIPAVYSGDDVSHTGDVLELNGSWEDFFRGQISLSGGNVANVEYLQPRCVPVSSAQIAKGTLWDYFGFPTASDVGDFSVSALALRTGVKSLVVDQSDTYDNFPLVYPWAAYNLVYNEYYRDENYSVFRSLNDNTVASCAYAKDYFTSALPYQQKGEPIALPVSSQITGDDYTSIITETASSTIPAVLRPSEGASSAPVSTLNTSPLKSPDARLLVSNGSLANSLSVTSSAFDVADLRFAFQVQKFLERSARGGTRYVEFLRAHYATFPRDERLQRPEYIGGSKQPVIISEVLQTGASEAGSPQGTMAGHAISVDSGFVGRYYVTEPGLIIGLMSIVPKAHYQQGIHRSWLRRTRLDYYFPEFQNLSEQGVEEAELYFSGVNDLSHDKKIIGYQGRYNELRMSTDEVCGDFRDILDYWHLGRKFSAAPSINQSFIYGSSEDTKRIFAVQDEDPILVSFGNLLRVSRPMVKYPEPGLVDHH